ncbi:MAG: ATP-binding cassette domain-containing protein, partial [Chlorobiales bacterium]|nr:ATP-binding cassette domain-containing protein [Chlorobiales bacterium]
MRSPVVTVKELSVILGGTKILDGLSLNVQEGEFLGIVGPNGGGKTTLLRVILG